MRRFSGARTSDQGVRQLKELRRLLRNLGGPGAGLLILLLMAPLALALALRAVPHLDVAFESVFFHLVAVSAIAACALLVALFTALVAAQARQAAPVLLALGCVFVGAFMLAHGLTTPGIGGRPMNMWVARSPVLAMAGFALCLGTAATRASSTPKRLVNRSPGPRWPRLRRPRLPGRSGSWCVRPPASGIVRSRANPP